MVSRRMRILTGCGLLLAAALACGGGGAGGTGAATAGPGPASGLAYTSPAGTGQWRLVRSATSTPGRLVLDLLAPDGAAGMGVVLDLRADPAAAAWEPDPAGTGSYAAPFVKASPAAGALRLLVTQLNPAPPVAYGAAPVLSVALDLAPGAQAGPVALSVATAGILPDRQTQPAPVTVAVGPLSAF